MLKRKLFFLWIIFRRSLQELLENDPLRLGAATAFFTIFALPPILIIFINLLGSVFSSEIISGELNHQLLLTFGPETADMLTLIIVNVLGLKTDPYLTVAGSLFLLFVATTLFIIVQNSINQLWDIKKKRTNKLKKVFFDRFKSFLIIMATGQLFLFSLFFDLMSEYIGDYFKEDLDPVWRVYSSDISSTVMSLLLVTLWFWITFRFLPNAKVAPKPLVTGAMVTGLLFTAGRFVLNNLLVNQNLGLIYGPAASVILILLFIFYASLILYFGACFIKIYSRFTRQQIQPAFNAVRFKVVEIEN